MLYELCVRQCSQGKFVIDTGGNNDTISAKTWSTDCEIDLRPTDFNARKAYLSSIGASGGTRNLAIFEGTIIENAIGGQGNDLSRRSRNQTGQGFGHSLSK